MNAMDNLTNLTTNPNDCVLTAEEINASYNLGLHIISVFVLLIVSLAGALLSVCSVRIKCLHINPIIVNTGKFFGSGVVLATGFIHMLPDAMAALTDPCLPDSWNVYGAYAGLFAMLAVLSMQLIEFFGHQRQHGALKKCQNVHPTTNGTISACEQKKDTDVEAANKDPPATPEIIIETPAHSHGIAFQDDSQNSKLSAYLLEFGIALHSVLIGVALGTTTGSNFVALFIALCFHQFFEAMALGAQIARVTHISMKSAFGMVIFFALTTPIGIAIGIGVNSGTYNPKAVASLLASGILDSISAGILIYVALVNLITAEMGANAHAFYALRNRLKVLYFVALYLGAGAMAVIGRWA